PSPDCREVYFIKRGDGPAAIWKVSIEGGTPVQVSHLTGGAPEGYMSISPDGRWLTYHRVSTGQEPLEENTTRIGALSTDASPTPTSIELLVFAAAARVLRVLLVPLRFECRSPR